MIFLKKLLFAPLFFPGCVPWTHTHLQILCILVSPHISIHKSACHAMIYLNSQSPWLSKSLLVLSPPLHALLPQPLEEPRSSLLGSLASHLLFTSLAFHPGRTLAIERKLIFHPTRLSHAYLSISVTHSSLLPSLFAPQGRSPRLHKQRPEVPPQQPKWRRPQSLPPSAAPRARGWS